MFRRVLQRVKSARADTVLAMAIPVGLMSVLVEAYYRTDMKDTESPLECAYDATNQLIQPHHALELQERGIVVIPAALSPAAVRAARQILTKDVLPRNTATPSANDDAVRQDSILWIQADDDDTVNKSSCSEKSTSLTNRLAGVVTTNMPPLVHCLLLIRGVTHALQTNRYNNRDGTSLPPNTSTPTSISTGDSRTSYRVPRTLQLAFYAGNRSAGYLRHLDACTKSWTDLGLLEWLRLSDYRARSITVILYLNDPDRPVSDGGILRCWTDQQEAVLVDVIPRGGTMVIFQSDRIEHMVLPSSVDRYALTSWVFREGEVVGTK